MTWEQPQLPHNQIPSTSTSTYPIPNLSSPNLFHPILSYSTLSLPFLSYLILVPLCRMDPSWLKSNLNSHTTNPFRLILSQPTSPLTYSTLSLAFPFPSLASQLNLVPLCRMDPPWLENNLNSHTTKPPLPQPSSSHFILTYFIVYHLYSTPSYPSSIMSNGSTVTWELILWAWGW